MPAGKKLISFATIIKRVYNPNPEQSMKISIRTAMALKTKALAGGLSLLFLLGGCHKKVNYFNGEIITVKDIPVSDTLTGERLLLDSIIANGRGISLSVTILIQSIGSLRPSDFMNFINAKRHELFHTL